MLRMRLSLLVGFAVVVTACSGGSGSSDGTEPERTRSGVLAPTVAETTQALPAGVRTEALSINYDRLLSCPTTDFCMVGGATESTSNAPGRPQLATITSGSLAGVFTPPQV